MKRKFIIVLSIIVLIIQLIMPIIGYAYEEIDSEADIGTETKTKSFFDSSITFSWQSFKNNEGLVDYGMCIPSNANEYEEIPLILWLHGWFTASESGNLNVDSISTKATGIPYAVLGGSSLENFSAYILCPKFPGNSVNQWWDPQEIQQLLDKILEEYNVDRDNVVIVGHSFGGGNTWKIANALPSYFSKAVICSGYFDGSTLLPMPTQWYVGTGDNSSALSNAQSYENLINAKAANYEKNTLYRISCGHGTPIVAYNKDDGTCGRNS